MQKDCITIALDVPALQVEAQRSEHGALLIQVRYRAMSRPCPRCGQLTSHVHQYHRQLKCHIPVWGQRVLLELRKRRFRCPGCRKVFMEPDEVCGWRRRSTRAFRRAMAEACRIATVKAVAARAGVSEALVQRALNEMCPEMLQDMVQAPTVLALDELWIGAKAGCVTLLYAPEEHWVLDLGPGRTQVKAETLLCGPAQRAQIKAVVIDMAEAYRQAVRYACPGARIVADKFHVLARLLRAVTKVVSRVQRTAERTDQRALRHRRLFTAPEGALSELQRRERDRLLRVYPALAQAWEIAQAFRTIYQAADREQAARALDAWWTRVRKEGPREFLGLRYMLTHWREEILNYFTYRVTNAFAEGKNNRIKAIIRAGYGYRNIANLTQRIMLTNPLTSTTGEALSPHFLT